jgi:hypothetical protein
MVLSNSPMLEFARRSCYPICLAKTKVSKWSGREKERKKNTKSDSKHKKFDKSVLTSRPVLVFALRGVDTQESPNRKWYGSITKLK